MPLPDRLRFIDIYDSAKQRHSGAIVELFQLYNKYLNSHENDQDWNCGACVNSVISRSGKLIQYWNEQ